MAARKPRRQVNALFSPLTMLPSYLHLYYNHRITIINKEEETLGKKLIISQSTEKKDRHEGEEAN